MKVDYKYLMLLPKATFWCC